MQKIICVCLLLPENAKATDGVFDSSGTMIRYVTAGEGPAVVLIHGWMADSSMWGKDSSGNTKLDTTKTKGFRLVALDCRGHGKSDKPSEAEKYGEEMAKDVVRLLDHLKIKKAHIVGYSSGAYIAGKVVATNPERVLSVVYAGQAPIVEGARPSDFAEVEVFAKAVEDGNGLGPYVSAVAPAAGPKPTEEQANAIAKYLFRGKDINALAKAGQSFVHLGVSNQQLKECNIPVLFIHGENESAHVKNKIAKARKLIGHGQVIVVRGANHITTLTNPDFGKQVVKFLRTVK